LLGLKHNLKIILKFKLKFKPKFKLKFTGYPQIILSYPQVINRIYINI